MAGSNTMQGATGSAANGARQMVVGLDIGTSKIVAMVAEISPTRRVTHAASRKASFRNSAPYHLVENPPQTVTRRDSLKL